MNESVDQWLARSLDDHRLSRAERKTVAALLEDRTEGIEPADLRTKAIALARAAVAEQAGPGLAGVLDWLADVIRATEHDGTADQDRRGDLAEVHFSPGDDCVDRIKSLLRGARRTVNICVFTITDDRISDAILDARDRGVSVRIVTDDDKSSDYGSDVERLRNAGIPVRIDRSEYHMHHKFAVFDEKIALTGSYNWTRGAARDNEENLIVSTDPRLVGPFVRAFEALWDRLR